MRLPVSIEVNGKIPIDLSANMIWTTIRHVSHQNYVIINIGKLLSKVDLIATEAVGH